MVFLDIGMPGMDGYEVARRMRQQPGLEKVVLAALTGWGQQEDRRRTAEAGFDHHLVKPPEPEGGGERAGRVETADISRVIGPPGSPAHLTRLSTSRIDAVSAGPSSAALSRGNAALAT